MRNINLIVWFIGYLLACVVKLPFSIIGGIMLSIEVLIYRLINRLSRWCDDDTVIDINNSVIQSAIYDNEAMIDGLSKLKIES